MIEGNQWRDLFEGVGMLVGQIIMSAATLFAVILAAYKLHLYRMYGETGLRWNVSQVTLWLEIISNSCRMKLIFYYLISNYFSKYVFFTWPSIH